MIKIKTLNQLRFNLGIKSKPFILYKLNKEKIDDEERNYFNGLISYWNNDFESAKKYFDYKFTVFSNLMWSGIILLEINYIQHNEKATEEIYGFLRSALQDIKGNSRYILEMSLIWYEFATGKYERIEKDSVYKTGNIKLGYYCFHKSRAEIAKGNISEGMEYLNKAYEFAKKEKRPALTQFVLNSYAFNSEKFGEKKKAQFYAKELSAHLGYWFDEEEMLPLIPMLETIVSILEDARHCEIFSNLVEKSGNKDEYYNEVVRKICSDDNQVMKAYYNSLPVLSEQKFELITYMSHIKSYSDTEFLEREIKYRETGQNIPLEESRKMLLKKFFMDFGRKRKDVFSEYYFSKDLKERQIIDKYCINYVRYKDYRDYVDEIITEPFYFSKLNLEPRLATLCLYCFNDEDRNTMFDILNSLNTLF